MKFFARLAIGFFLICLVILGFVFFFGPPSLQASFRSHPAPVGQIDASKAVVSPGQPARHQ
jgi:hypothetical protein